MMKQHARMKRLLVAVLTAALVVGGGPQAVVAGSLDGTENKTAETAEIPETDKETPEPGQNNPAGGGETGQNTSGGGEAVVTGPGEGGGNGSTTPVEGGGSGSTTPTEGSGSGSTTPTEGGGNGSTTPVEGGEGGGKPSEANPPAEEPQNPEENGSATETGEESDPQNGRDTLEQESESGTEQPEAAGFSIASAEVASAEVQDAGTGVTVDYRNENGGTSQADVQYLSANVTVQ